MSKKKLTAVLLIAVVAVVIAAVVIAALTLQKRQMLISVTAETRDKTVLDLGKWHGRFLTTETVYTAVIYDIDKFEDAFFNADEVFYFFVVGLLCFHNTVSLCFAAKMQTLSRPIR